MTPRKRLVYDVFRLLRTHIFKDKRVKFFKDYVLSVSNKVTVKLIRKESESRIHDAPSTSADDILAALADVYNESILAVRCSASEEFNVDTLDVVDDVPNSEGGEYIYVDATKTKVTKK